MDDVKKQFIFLTVFVGAVFSGYLLIKLAGVLTPFLVGFFLAYLFNPLVTKLSSFKVKNRYLPRTIGVLLVFLVLTLLIAALVLWLIPILTNQLSLLVTNMTDWFVAAEQAWAPFLAEKLNLNIPDLNLSALNIAKGKSLLSDHAKQISQTMGSISAVLLKSGMNIVGWVVKLGIALVVLFYLLRDWPKIVSNLEISLSKYYYGQIFCRIIHNCNAVLSVFLRGQLLVMMALGLIYAIGLSLIGLNYAILLGFISGLLSIVPYLGGAVGLMMSLLVGYFQFHDWQIVMLVLSVFGVGQLLESTVLTPNLVGDKLGLHPVVVIFAIMAGGELFGFFGVLLALPVAAMLVVLVKDFHQIRGSNDVGPTAI